MITLVKSSNIAAVCYDSGNLYIEFHNGSVYSYADFPYEDYESMLTSESAGKFFHANIKDKFISERLSTEQAESLGFLTKVTAD